VRTHPVDNALFYLGRVAPLVLLGAGADEVLAAIYLGGALGILSHANLEVSDWGLGLFFNLPRAHSVHHSADAVEANSNFGCHTVLWDRLFGTFRPAPQPGLVLGVKPVGPRSLWQQLAWPFYRWVS
jgi:sterol desaturase/sphingolipid hydroxylase (fatty acid hydroxylase superfamily)